MSRVTTSASPIADARPAGLRDRLRWMIYPGVNLHARLRYRELPAYFGAAAPGVERRVLDAGCGNGMLSYRAYLKGNRITGISIKPGEVASCTRQFNQILAIPPERMSFSLANLYDVDYGEAVFDEIICTEVLEHIERDDEVCRKFWRFLKPGGRLHITSPNADHPYNSTQHLDEDESGGHVRDGYTLATYKALLEPIGFRIDATRGVGGPVRQAFNRRIREAQERGGPSAGLPLFLASLPLLPLDGLRSGGVPFSIYVRAVKPA